MNTPKRVKTKDSYINSPPSSAENNLQNWYFQSPQTSYNNGQIFESPSSENHKRGRPR
jgi:hypothetical protein